MIAQSSDPEVPPGSKLELVADDYTDEEHRKLDGELSGADPSTNIAAMAPLLLYILVGQLKQRASEECKTVSACRELIAENPDLLDMLVKGAQRGFKLVRRLKILRNVPVTLGESMNVEPQFTITRAAERAWDLEYRGHYAQILWDNINNLPRAATHPNCISVIQSSGYGKSRMVDELAKFVFTIPLNIRNPTEQTTDGAYPPSDPDVWKYLFAKKVNEVDVAERVVSSFFSNLFRCVADEVENTFRRTDQVSQDTFARKWREHLSKPAIANPLETHRSRLYKNVVVYAEADKQNPGLKQAVMDNLLRLLDVLSPLCSYPPLDESGEHCVQIILYFDEAHELARDIGDGKKFYDAVWSILAEFQDERVFSIFLSTQSSISLLAPSSQTARSSRQQNTKVLWGPVTKTPFDCHPTFPLRPGEYGLAEVSRLPFMMKFGRPLFWTMFARKQPLGEEHLSKDMMNLARKKLLFEENIHSEPRLVDQNARIAIMDVLITIDYEPKRESARQFEMQLVASHMRTAFSIPPHRMYVRSGYPSEPFLAEAASRQMHHFMQADMSFHMIEDLNAKLKEGLIDLGQKCEVVMRLLLRKAYMDAIVGEQGADKPNFSLGCSFIKFLEALLAEPHDAAVRNCKPDNIAISSNDDSAPVLAVAFKDAVVRFTHFADEAAMGRRGMVMGFLRGAAIIGWNSQKKVDIAIPILMNKQHKIEEASISALLIQVKQRMKPGSVNAYLIDATKIDFLTEDSERDPRPYVTLIAELGTRRPAKSDANVAFGEPPQRSSPRKRGKGPYPRYSIRAYECTPNTWKVVSDDLHYKEILVLDDLFGEHPRQDDASLKLVYQMLPFWNSTPSWFSAESDVAMEPTPEEPGLTELSEGMETD